MWAEHTLFYSFINDKSVSIYIKIAIKPLPKSILFHVHRGGFISFLLKRCHVQLRVDAKDQMSIPRMATMPIGISNSGISWWIKSDYPHLNSCRVPTIV